MEVLANIDTLGEEVILSKDVLGTHRPYAAIVVTRLLPKGELFELNDIARANGIAFILAITNGVTSSIFSDFGPHHEITDATGEPTQMLAMSNVEVLESKPKLLQVNGVKDGEMVVIVTVAQTDHGLEDGDVVILEDMRDGMKCLNGKSVTVKRVAIASPVSIQLEMIIVRRNGNQAHSLPLPIGLCFYFLSKDGCKSGHTWSCLQHSAGTPHSSCD